ASVIIPVVNDWLNDCGDSGAPGAAGADTPGTDGPPTPTAGALGSDAVETLPGGNTAQGSGAAVRQGTWLRGWCDAIRQ
ncbi:hypothetical protein F0Q45_26495, partial [Mycobacterium simiae]